jgi:cytochrome c oxidase subunit 3
MEATVTTANSEENLGGGDEPMGASYGKLMMWFSSYQML